MRDTVSMLFLSAYFYVLLFRITDIKIIKLLAFIRYLFNEIICFIMNYLALKSATIK